MGIQLDDYTAFVWSSTPVLKSKYLCSMAYASPNSDGSFSGYNTTSATKQLLKLPKKRRALLFQSMLEPLFRTPEDVAPFYNNGAMKCQKNVKEFFTVLKNNGVDSLAAVIPDVEGVIFDWQISIEVATAIINSPEVDAFLEEMEYTGNRDGKELFEYCWNNRPKTQLVLMKYADNAIYEAIKPLLDLYGDVLIQKWSIAVPDYAARTVSFPCPASDGAKVSFKSSYAQCDEIYGSKCPEEWGFPNTVWTAAKMADMWLTRLAAAKSNDPKPLIPWIAPKSYDGENASHSGSWIPWANTPEYDRMLDGVVKLTNGRILYWRPAPATEADDAVIEKALKDNE
jgi:hypothetical protein